MKSKKCPGCLNIAWNYDVNDGIFTWCGDCFHAAKRSGFFERFNGLMESVQTKMKNEEVKS